MLRGVAAVILLACSSLSHAEFGWNWAVPDGGKNPCEWCLSHPAHIWCKGWGGKYCLNGEECSVVLREVLANCGSQSCQERCLHAIAASPSKCLDRLAESGDARAMLVRDAVRSACPLHPDSKWGSGIVENSSLPLVVFMHMQKAGGWSVVSYARRVGIRCPNLAECTYKPAVSQDLDMLRSRDQEDQRAVLAALAQAYGLIHLEQVFSPAPLPPNRSPGSQRFEYVTIMREPISRMLSHFRMATRFVKLQGVYEGLPFPQVANPRASSVTIDDFARRPLTQCLLCKLPKKHSPRMHAQEVQGAHLETLRGGGEYRHCCSRQWRYAADNFYVRELVGAATLADIGFGNVTDRHEQIARERLGLFKVILITEQLHLAPHVLRVRLGWPVASFDIVNPAANAKEAHRVDEIDQEPEFRAQPGALAWLRQHNLHDISIYGTARALWDQHLREARENSLFDPDRRR